MKLAQVTVPSFDDPVGGTTQTVTQTQQQDSTSVGSDWAYGVMSNNIWSGTFAFSLVLSLVLAVGLVYSLLRIRQLRAQENEFYDAQPLSSVARRVYKIGGAQTGGSASEIRWRDVLHHVDSNEPNNWRLAILEADVMLDDAITQRGYTGEGLGEKMKQINKSDINSIDDAWEAHKVRNRIAHEGNNFELTQRETKRVINLYERVFRELNYIS